MFKTQKDLLPEVIHSAECAYVANKYKEDPFYQSYEWRMLRYKVLKKHKAKCMCCGTSGEFIQLHVDHIKPRSKYPELELEFTNMQVLCQPCNGGKSNTDETDWRPPSRKPTLNLDKLCSLIAQIG